LIIENPASKPTCAVIKTKKTFGGDVHILEKRIQLQNYIYKKESKNGSVIYEYSN
jgi:hypothetical protein